MTLHPKPIQPGLLHVECAVGCYTLCLSSDGWLRDILMPLTQSTSSHTCIAFTFYGRALWNCFMVQRHVTETNSSNSNSKDPEDAMVRYIERVAGRAQPDMRKDDEDESWGKWRSSPARDPCRLMSTCVCVCVWVRLLRHRFPVVPRHVM